MDDKQNGQAFEELGYEPDLMTLMDEEGNEHVFEVVDACDFEDERYLAMVPYAEDAAERLGQDAEMLIMRVGEENGEEILDIVEDDEELVRVGNEFLRRLEEVYDIDLAELES